MSRGFQGAVLKALGANDHGLTVTGVEDVTPHYRRIRFHSPTLLSELEPAPATWLRLWVPDLTDPTKEHQRGYTVLDADAATGELSIEFVLHEPVGAASGWAARAQVGDELRATVYGATKFTPPDPAPAGYLLVGDAASTPAINAIVAAVPPGTPIELYLEWSHEGDEDIPIAEHPGLVVHRVVRRADGSAVAEALAGRDWSDWYAWVGAERRTVKRLRAELRDVHGFPKSEVKAQAYWMEGASLGASRAKQRPAAAPVPAVPAAGGAPAAAAATTEAQAPARRGWRSQAGAELLGPVRLPLRLAGLLQALVTLAELVPFIVLVEVARRMLRGAEPAELWPPARTALIVLGAATLVGSALVLWMHVVDARLGASIRRTILAKLARLPLGWFTERNSGVVKALVQDDTASLHYRVTHAVLDVVAALVAPLTVLAYLLFVDARLTLVLLIPLAAYGLVFNSMLRESGSKIGEVAAWGRRMNGEAVSFMDGLAVLRSFGGTSASRFSSTVDGYIGFLEAWQRPFVGKKTLVGLITRPTTFLWLIAVVGTPMVVGGTLSPEDLLPFLLVGTGFGAQIMGLAYGAGGLRESAAAAKRIGLVLTEDELAVADGSAPVPVDSTVELRGVHFGYRADRPVLEGIDLTLAPGTVTAVVGPSGSGKSTLAALVARFHDVDEGSVSIGGVDVRRLPLDELHRRVGFVFQDVKLLSGTVRDNIALARPDSPLEAVRAAAAAAHIDERIMRLPRGYDSVVGTDVVFSTGEAQRVTVARALVADAPVLLLDEATAFADPEAEYHVQAALTELMAGRTVLVIAHRLHTIVDADQIVVLEAGRVAQRGTHDELLAAGGRYRDLWEAAGRAGVVEVAR